jgi:hypothetical protein
MYNGIMKTAWDYGIMNTAWNYEDNMDYEDSLGL